MMKCSIAPLNRLRAGLQGGGVYVASYGVANFESCNIHDNTATYVCLHLLNFPEVSSIAPMEQTFAHV